MGGKMNGGQKTSGAKDLGAKYQGGKRSGGKRPGGKRPGGKSPRTDMVVHLRIDYCDEHVIQEISYISWAILLIHNYYISFKAQYFSLLDHTSKNGIGHKLSEQ